MPPWGRLGRLVGRTCCARHLGAGDVGAGALPRWPAAGVVGRGGGAPAPRVLTDEEAEALNKKVRRGEDLGAEGRRAWLAYHLVPGIVTALLAGVRHFRQPGPL
jgi:hypothetical protein